MGRSTVQTYSVTRTWTVTDVVEVRATSRAQAEDKADDIEKFPLGEHDINIIECDAVLSES